MDPAISVAASAALCGWVAAAAWTRPRPPLVPGRVLGIVPAAAGAFLLAALAYPGATFLAALVTLVGGVFVAATRPERWVRTTAVAWGLAGAVGLAIAGAGGAADAPVARVALVLGGGALFAVYRFRATLAVPAVARGLVAAAVAAGIGWAAALPLAAGIPAPVVVLAQVLSAGASVVGFEVASPRLRDWPPVRREPLEPDAGDLVLDRFRVEARLGAGAHGATFRARDDVTGDTVAIKWLMRAPGNDPLLLDEVEALRLVDHPNVVRLIDAGSDRRSGTVLVMEHVAGGSLADRLRTGPLDLPSFDRVAEDLAAALEAVHDAGLVHQDVKPSNLLLASDGSTKLADFGIARLPGLEATMDDRTVVPVGTARFMSPEEARGRRATPASDVYAAGATLYEALTGTPYLTFGDGMTFQDALGQVSGTGTFDGPLPDERYRAFFAGALHPSPVARWSDGGALKAAWHRVVPRDPGGTESEDE